MMGKAQCGSEESAAGRGTGDGPVGLESLSQVSSGVSGGRCGPDADELVDA
ncbi:hypothetical protein [Streptomyces sp. BBFR102]|uniref:hypothetical protein n=1 Tax=Streptomyces sp. BBFR102 TaxID=3448171 RepID=UPI003F52A190